METLATLQTKQLLHEKNHTPQLVSLDSQCLQHESVWFSTFATECAGSFLTCPGHKFADLPCICLSEKSLVEVAAVAAVEGAVVVVEFVVDSIAASAAFLPVLLFHQKQKGRRGTYILKYIP